MVPHHEGLVATGDIRIVIIPHAHWTVVYSLQEALRGLYAPAVWTYGYLLSPIKMSFVLALSTFIYRPTFRYPAWSKSSR